MSPTVQSWVSLKIPDTIIGNFLLEIVPLLLSGPVMVHVDDFDCQSVHSHYVPKKYTFSVLYTNGNFSLQSNNIFTNLYYWKKFFGLSKYDLRDTDCMVLFSGVMCPSVFIPITPIHTNIYSDDLKMTQNVTGSYFSTDTLYHSKGTFITRCECYNRFIQKTRNPKQRILLW